MFGLGREAVEPPGRGLLIRGDAIILSGIPWEDLINVTERGGVTLAGKFGLGAEEGEEEDVVIAETLDVTQEGLDVFLLIVAVGLADGTGFGKLVGQGRGFRGRGHGEERGEGLDIGFEIVRAGLRFSRAIALWRRFEIKRGGKVARGRGVAGGRKVEGDSGEWGQGIRRGTGHCGMCVEIGRAHV